MGQGPQLCSWEGFLGLSLLCLVALDIGLVGVG